MALFLDGPIPGTFSAAALPLLAARLLLFYLPFFLNTLSKLFSSSPAPSAARLLLFICLFFFSTLFLNFSAAALPHLAARLLLFICLFCSTLFLNFSAPALPHLLVAISSPCRFFAAGLVIPRHLYAKGGIFRLFFLQNNSPPDFRVWTACVAFTYSPPLR